MFSGRRKGIWSRLPKKTSWPKKGRIKTTLPPAYVPITGVCLFSRIKYVYPEYPKPFHLDPLFEATQRVGLFFGGIMFRRLASRFSHPGGIFSMIRCHLKAKGLIMKNCGFRQ